MWSAFEDPDTGEPPEALIAASLVAVLAFYVWNQGILRGQSGASVGDRLMRVRLVDAASVVPIGPGRGIGHAFAQFLNLPVCGLGFWWPLWDAKRQTFADKITRSVVLSDELVHGMGTRRM